MKICKMYFKAHLPGIVPGSGMFFFSIVGIAFGTNKFTKWIDSEYSSS